MYKQLIVHWRSESCPKKSGNSCLEICIQISYRQEMNTLRHSPLIPYLRGQNLDNIFMDTGYGEQLQIITFLLMYQIRKKKTNKHSIISSPLSVLGLVFSLDCFCRISDHARSCTHSCFLTVRSTHCISNLNRCLSFKV